MCAVLAGSHSFAAIAQWGGELPEPDQDRLGLARSRALEESTFRRVRSSLDAALLRGRTPGML